MKIKLLFFALLISGFSFSQGEASNWFFGTRAGIRFNPDNSVSVLSNPGSSIGINTTEGCSSYSDGEGNLLFYTDGRSVWDKRHRIMPNGNYFAGTGLLGDPSSTQSGIIIPKPNSTTLFYIFTVDEPHHENAAVYPNQNLGNGYPNEDDGLNNGLNYSTVDISVIGTRNIGDVVSRNVPLITYDTNSLGEEIKYKCSEKVTAVKSKNNTGYWVITHFTDKFYAFKIDASGVNSTPVISQNNPMVPVSGYRRNGIGYIKVSPNGKKIAIAHNQMGTQTGGSENNGAVYLYDFDNETGVVSNGVMIVENISPYGVEFSAETKKLYVSGENVLYQFDLNERDIAGSKFLLAERNYSALQLGPDKKIYKANITVDDRYLDVINYPELYGDAAGFQPRAISLSSGRSKFGLPPFITSIFTSAIISDGNCFSFPTNFSIETEGTLNSVTWDFGDGIGTSTASSPNYTYPNPGTYRVKATTVIDGNRSENFKNVTISPLPVAVATNLVQCSIDGAQTNILFDLNQAYQNLTSGVADQKLTFFKSKLEALSGSNELDAEFRNTSNPETLHVKVTNNTTGCSSIATLELIVNIGTPRNYELSKCDDDGTEDGLSLFDLREANIAADFASNAVISYYLTSDDAFLKRNVIPNQFTTTTANSQEIYARVDVNNSCEGIFRLKVIVHPLPNIETEATDYICTNLPAKFTTLTAGLLSGNPSNFRYKWSNGQETQTIKVNTAGIYTVVVTNVFGCERIRTITVLESNNATINDVEIHDNSENNTVTVHLSNTSLGDYLYGLDAPNGPFQESNHFENLNAGFHTIYVYDSLGCGIVSQEISILKVPKFFTPNGDGYNDTWDIVGISPKFYANSKIYIFDRFGKLLADVNPLGIGWNGIHDGQPLPSNDYWYVVRLENGRIIRGHFSLVR